MLGVIAQSIGDVCVRLTWLDVAVAAFFGGLIASEFIVRWRDFGPVVGGLALMPAIIGGLLLGIGVDAGIRAESHGSYWRHPHT